MKYLLPIFLILLFSSSYSTGRKQNTCLQMDLMLLADYSESVQGQEQFIIDALNAFVNKFELSERALKIGVFTFNNSTYKLSRLTSDKEELIKQINSLSHKNAFGGTDMTDALEITNKELFSETARPTFRKLIIAITDGNPNDELSCYFMAVGIKKMGVGICGVMVQDSSSQPVFLKTICQENCYVETDYNSLVDELRKLDVCF